MTEVNIPCKLHEGKEREVICLNDQCKEEDNLLCLICLFEKHKKCFEKTIPIDSLKTKWPDLIKGVDAKILNSHAELQVEMDKQITKIEEMIPKVMTQIETFLKDIVTGLRSFEDRHKLELSFAKFLKPELFADQQNVASVPDFESFNKMLRFFIAFEGDKGFQLHSQLENFSLRFRAALEGINQWITDWPAQLEQFLLRTKLHPPTIQAIRLHRFQQIKEEGDSWYFAPNKIDAITFKPNKNCYLNGIGHYYCRSGRGFRAKLEVFEGDKVSNQMIHNQEFIVNEITDVLKGQKKYAYDMYFMKKLPLTGGKAYTIALYALDLNDKNTKCYYGSGEVNLGEYCQVMNSVFDKAGVTSNGTGTATGQVPYFIIE